MILRETYQVDSLENYAMTAKPSIDPARMLHDQLASASPDLLRGAARTAVKPGRSRRYHTPLEAARTITALLALRDQVIAPIIAGVRSPRRRRKPAHWTRIDRDYENLRAGMRVLFHDLGIDINTAAA